MWSFPLPIVRSLIAEAVSGCSSGSVGEPLADGRDSGDEAEGNHDAPGPMSPMRMTWARSRTARGR